MDNTTVKNLGFVMGPKINKHNSKESVLCKTFVKKTVRFSTKSVRINVEKFLDFSILINNRHLR